MADDQTLSALARPWAKHSKKAGVHALACHLIDTMEVAYQLYPIFLGPKVRGELDQMFEPLTGSVRDWVALLCGLHDLGKYTPAFQALVLKAAKARFPPEEHPVLERNAPARPGQRWDTKHGVGTAVHLQKMLQTAGASTDTAVLISHVLGGHHGWFPVPDLVAQSGGKDDLGDHGWEEARSEMVREIAKLRGLDFDDVAWREVKVSSLGLLGLAGLTTISDWVASDSSRFAYRADPGDLHAYGRSAREQAERTLRESNWMSWTPPENTGFRELFGEEPRPLQRVVERSLEHCDEPGVLVIEAPTGEGKTKGGLQAAATLARRLGLGGIYLATPTKALSRQAFDDLDLLLKGTGSPLDVNLVYAGASRDLKVKRASTQIRPSAVGEDGEGGQNAMEWFTRKRGLAFPVGVGTIDQLLKSVIRSGHNYLGMSSLSNKVVIIDEAHAYDFYTGTLVDQLMWYLGRMGVPVVLMSATLPADRREELIGAWQAGAAEKAPDPEVARVAAVDGWQVTWAGTRRHSFSFALSEKTTGRGPIRIGHVDAAPETIAMQVVARVGDAGTALVVLDTRARAQNVYERIKALLDDEKKRPELVLFTGESEGKDRTKIEERIRSLLGRQSPEDRHAIVVGTQVLEHGLDIDADLMVSDLCPIDLLFQRAGRLHRHRRNVRPDALTTPTLLVADVDPRTRAEQTASVRKRSLMFATRISAVYDALLLGRTRMVLRDVLARGTWDPLDEIPKQIHRVYLPDEALPEEGWEAAWEQAELGYARKRVRLRFQASALMTGLIRHPRNLLRLTRRSGPAGRTRPSDGREKGRQ